MLSIKPEYAEQLINGSKRFEYRRSAIHPEVSHIVIYASSPTKRILGIFAVKRIMVTDPMDAWKQTKDSAGISRKAFVAYFKGASKAYCIEVDPGSIVRVNDHVHPTDLEAGFSIPQSFRYLNDSYFRLLLKHNLELAI